MKNRKLAADSSSVELYSSQTEVISFKNLRQAEEQKMSIPDEYVNTNNLMKRVANLKDLRDVTLVAGNDKLK